ncbi:MAG TPA: hypothetical protein VGM90_07135 [Kofleriaceae bacterium]|jgi:hypothetical protein
MEFLERSVGVVQVVAFAISVLIAWLIIRQAVIAALDDKLVDQNKRLLEQLQEHTQQNTLILKHLHEQTRLLQNLSMRGQQDDESDDLPPPPAARR